MSFLTIPRTSIFSVFFPTNIEYYNFNHFCFLSALLAVFFFIHDLVFFHFLSSPLLWLYQTEVAYPPGGFLEVSSVSLFLRVANK